MGTHRSGAAGHHRRPWKPASHRRFAQGRVRAVLAIVLAPALIVGIAMAASGNDAGLQEVAQAVDEPDPAAGLLPLPAAPKPAAPAPPKTAPAQQTPVPEAGNNTKRSGPTGRYLVARGTDAAPTGKGRIVRYLVEVEEGLRANPALFAAEVHRILNDERSWGRGGQVLRFVRVDSGAVRFRVSLSSPTLTDRQCHPLRTFGRVSCFNGRRSVINNARWQHGSWTYGKDVARYREYLINHEVGHALGRRHVGCTTPGAPAPVMVQQTKSLEGCTANAWPYAAR
ncbi:MAG: DUF3152 domain-containing protein [Sporichthyaceae bacterium]